MKNLKLSTQLVETIFLKSLFAKDEIVDNQPIFEPIKVEGITIATGFNPKRLYRSKNIINHLVDQLEDIENGPHFTQLCQTKDGEQWTDYHRAIEQLMLLGIANNSLSYALPKEMWQFTAGVPYVIRKKE